MKRAILKNNKKRRKGSDKTMKKKKMGRIIGIKKEEI